MALTQGAWSSKTYKRGGQSFAVHTCTVTATTAENDAYTLLTPTSLDTTRAFTLFIYASATVDGSTLPVDLWCGWSSDFEISGDGGDVTATDGAEWGAIYADVKAAGTYMVMLDPQSNYTDVSDKKVRIPSLPYYAFNLDGGSTLNAVSVVFYLVQVQRGQQAH